MPVSRTETSSLRFSDFLLGNDEGRVVTTPPELFLPVTFVGLYLEYLYTNEVHEAIPLILFDKQKEPKNKPKVLTQVGVDLPPETFITHLRTDGLERSTVGIQPGTYVVAGDTVLVWYTAWTSPVRVEWWGDRVEAITVINNELHPIFSLMQLIAPQIGIKDEYRMGWGTMKGSLAHTWQTCAIISSTAGYSITSIPEFAEFQGDLSTTQRRFLLEKVYQHYVESLGYGLSISTSDLALIKKEYPFLKQFTQVGSRTNKGWIARQDKVILLTDHELVGTIDIINTQQNWLRLHTRIKVGDFVVHRDHGIARYEGIKRLVPPSEVVAQIQQIDPDYRSGKPVDYLHLQYAGNDELFVPYWQSQKVGRYVGSGEHKPQLTPLYSGQWQATTKRVKRAVEKISQDLVRLYALRQQITVSALSVHWDEVTQLIKSFRFLDTTDQAKVTREVLADLTRTRPMDRLLVGDVGFGKTELAVRAAFAVARNKEQVAILAPTTILTQQHMVVFTERLVSYGLRIEVLNRNVPPAQQKKILEAVRSGEIDIVIGTHRLLGKDVIFKKLGLIIIDEEQNFGVKQKEKLKGLRLGAHVLSMSATPIPRTLNFSILGVRDLSVIHTAPPHRKQVEVQVARFVWGDLVVGIANEMKRKGQTLIVYNRVLQIRGFTETLASKLKSASVSARVAYAHGQLAPEELTSIMQRYYRGEIDVLVASTIVQNGIDIPNVNTLFVVHAERFGLAQLYQLKGRIGRSERQGYAHFLLGEGDGYRLTKAARRRLQAIEQITQLGSGFSIASQDMAIRGVGNLLGKEQHGTIDTVGFALYQQMLEEAVKEQLDLQKVGDKVVIEAS